MVPFWLVLLFLFCLYLLDDRIKFAVKYVFFVLFVMLASVIMILLALCRIIPKEDVENFDIARILIINLMKIFRLKMNVQKVDNLQIDGPSIIVANHQSSLDLLGMMRVMPRRCAPLAKQELKWAGPFGFAAAICGTVFIDRLNHQSAMATMQRVAEQMTSKNITVWIFPEGTRHHGKGMLPFKKGAFHLAVQAQIPIVPVIFSCFHNFYDKRKYMFLTPGEFTIEALPAISTSGLTVDDVPELMSRVRKDMMDAYLRISDLQESDLDRDFDGKTVVRPLKSPHDVASSTPTAAAPTEAPSVVAPSSVSATSPTIIATLPQPDTSSEAAVTAIATAAAAALTVGTDEAKEEDAVEGSDLEEATPELISGDYEMISAADFLPQSKPKLETSWGASNY